ncbi:MAG: Ig-like surface protein [Pedosphaera sp.]|nr:Ig-like surface protein [Pedosphaera sp.]
MKTTVISTSFSWIVLTMLAFPIVAQAQLLYTTINNTIQITGYTGGDGGHVNIPATINGLPVTSIGDSAFRFSNVSVVTIPGSVTSIGIQSFANCASLYVVRMTNGVISIGDYAFWFCTGLPSITVPASVTSIGFQAFGGCKSLSGLTVDSLNSYYSVVQGVLFDKSQSTLIQYLGGTSGTNYAIPVGVSSIGKYAFQDARLLVTVIVPQSVTSIGGGAFFGAAPNLTSVYCLGNAPGVGLYAFRGLAATAYYLPGTEGWVTTLGELPTRLWNPQVLTTNASFGVQDNQFGFTITGTANIPVVVEACSNLISPTWISLQRCSVTNGSIYFSDPAWTINPRRFYRIRSP